MKKPAQTSADLPAPTDVFPSSGGSWILDPVTGALTRNTADASVPRPVDPAAESDAAPSPVPPTNEASQ